MLQNFQRLPFSDIREETVEHIALVISTDGKVDASALPTGRPIFIEILLDVKVVDMKYED